LSLRFSLTQHHAMKAYWGSGHITPCILDLGTIWRWMVNFTPRPFYPQGKSPWYPLDRRLDGPQTQWWRRKFPAPAGTGTPIIQSVAQRYAIELFRLLCAFHGVIAVVPFLD
jgi:hypothetical protein